MEVINCEQGSEEWFMHRKGIPTASCFSKIVQPSLASKTTKNTTKKTEKLIQIAFDEGDITADSMVEGMKNAVRIKAGESLTNESEGHFILEPGATLITQGGFKPSASARDYICLLIAESKFKAPAQWLDILKAVRHGIESEPEARRLYEFMHDTTVEQVGFCKTDDGRFGSSPDGLVEDRKGGLEIKCPNADTHFGYVMDAILPHKYRLQVHGSMFVTGCEYWDFMSYTEGEDPFIIRTHRDDYTDKLGAALDLFYTELTAAREKFGVTV